jgi:hypothetical protein
MNKLNEIKQRIDDYNNQMKKHPQADKFRDDLLALLPVVEAAEKLKPYDFYDPESDCCIGCAGIALSHNSIDRTVEFDHQEDCEVEELFTALATLQQEGKQS